MNNKIIRKVYYVFKLRLASPLCISGSKSEVTDKDIICNGEGDVFIPGSSIAGAFREAIKDRTDFIMGFSEGEKGSMSRLFISDMFFDAKPKISVRDGVQLTSEKTVDNKFDMEIIETGARTKLYVHYIERDNDNYDYEDAIKKLIAGLESGTIRFGANKNRGMGRICVDSTRVYRKEISRENLNKSYDFLKNIKNISLYDSSDYNTWKAKDYKDDKYIKITVPLKLTGGISIRHYSVKPGQPDFEHITCNGEPVIPGSSWNGAIRSDCLRILKEIGCERSEELIGKWFGTTEHKSNVVIGESIIRNSVSLPMTRNRINRFDNSTQNGALYTERAFFGGNTRLEIMVRKDSDIDYEALIGLLEIVIQDIIKGYLPVGGMVGVGRGIFEADGETIYSENIGKDCAAQLYSMC